MGEQAVKRFLKGGVREPVLRPVASIGGVGIDLIASARLWHRRRFPYVTSSNRAKRLKLCSFWLSFARRVEERGDGSGGDREESKELKRGDHFLVWFWWK